MSFNWISLDNPVAIWWLFLVAASVVNVGFWFWLKHYWFKSTSINTLWINFFDERNMIWLSGIYTFVCAFRSFLPRADVQRIVLFDTWWSSVLVGRTVATIGEMAFAGQWAIIFFSLYRLTKRELFKFLAFFILLAISVAEICSWYAVIRTHYLGNVIEESLWAVTHIMVAVGLLWSFYNLKGPLRGAAGVAVFGCVLYIFFMLGVDVPMYWTRYQQDLTEGKVLLNLFDGFSNLNSYWLVTHDIQDWRTEIPWKTLYFTFAVWVSLSLCFVPLDQKRLFSFLKLHDV